VKKNQATVSKLPSVNPDGANSRNWMTMALAETVAGYHTAATECYLNKKPWMHIYS